MSTINVHTYRVHVSESPAAIGKYLVFMENAGWFLEPRFTDDRYPEGNRYATFRAVVDDFGNLRVVERFL